MKEDPRHPGKHINPETGCWPISEWGPECGRGFVSNERFARGGERVIKRANRAKTKKWYQLMKTMERKTNNGN